MDNGHEEMTITVAKTYRIHTVSMLLLLGFVDVFMEENDEANRGVVSFAR